MWIDAFNWPLENFCARLYVDLFHAKWEIRHGAATALRELINQHASGAGKGLNMTREEVGNSFSDFYFNFYKISIILFCVERLDANLSQHVA